MQSTLSSITKEQLDSNEELYFLWYLIELHEAGYILEATYHEKSWLLSREVKFLKLRKKQLKTKVKTETLSFKLLGQHTYTPDFVITWDKSAEGIFFDRIKPISNVDDSPSLFIATDGMMSLIDVKGAHDGRLSSASTFPLNQKWMYWAHGLYVQKIIPVVKTKKGTGHVYTGLFPSTFTPKRYLLSDGGGKVRTINYKPKSLTEYAELRAKEKGLL